MADQESLAAAIQERVELVPYDRTWPTTFAPQRRVAGGPAHG
jgi:hypothetical protein